MISSAIDWFIFCFYLSNNAQKEIYMFNRLIDLIWFCSGLQEYEAALKIDPENEQLKKDAENIRHTIQTETVSWVVIRLSTGLTVTSSLKKVLFIIMI